MRTNRKHKVLTFTFDEWDKIEKLAARGKMKTATYIKASALRGKVIVIDLKENRDYIVALNRIGTNINQIARVANETGYIHSDDLRRLEDFKEEICRISRSYQSKIQSLAA
ncbi:MAG: plasmid mobilization relaxosome protein MobC [Ruminiclostridium sp.]|nr:plasmid mobilization relaxosome protein MobC [Ruminiclostridium sp.]